MEKLKMYSKDKVKENVEKIAELFPNVLTERISADGKVEYALDFDVLRQELSNVIVEGNDERYQFTWPNKKNSILLANSPIAKTLRPYVEESVDFDNTENIYIEGDNLEALKLLQETYLGKVKMIYIDPPYNTGNDFVYEDDFVQSSTDYLKSSGQLDDSDNRLVQNTESNGRFHTDWLNMIYPRLKVARDILNEEGIIFISIDDHEIENIKKVCNELFGNDNFVGELIWRGGRRNAAKVISTSHEYMLVYAKNLNYCLENNILWREKKNGLENIFKQAEKFVIECNYDYSIASNKLKEWFNSLSESNESKLHKHYNWIDKNGVYFASDISRGGGGGPKWDLINPYTGNIVKTPSRGWSFSKYDDLLEKVKNDEVHFNGDGVPCAKIYLKNNDTQLVETVFYKDRRGASKRLKNLLGGSYFDFPKDEEIIKSKIKTFVNDKNSIILDFFSGSSTTAHAVMKLNSEDGGNRKFIMVQIDELTYEGKKEKYLDDSGNVFEKYIIDNETGYPEIVKDSEARKAGYYTISQIGKERIRKAGKKIKEETGLEAQNLDIGFRVLKVDSTNMKDVFYKPEDYKPALFDELEDNIKEDRTPLDLLFQVMLEMDVLLSSKIEEKEISGKKVFSVMDDYLIACFDKGISKEVVEAIAKKQPYYAVFRDSCMEDDSTMTSFEQIFETYSKDTIRKVL